MEDLRYIGKQLRRKIDAKDPFMTHGHQILKPRSDDKKGVPEWATNDQKVREIVLRAFPKFAENGRQRKAAARWIRIIHLYFRMGMTRGQVAEEMGIKPGVVKGIVEGIRQVAAGKQYHRKVDRGIKPRGRPRKIACLFKPILAEHAKPNLFRTRSLVSSRTSRKSKRHTCRRVQVRPRRSRS